jgi:hypothetical protein
MNVYHGKHAVIVLLRYGLGWAFKEMEGIIWLASEQNNLGEGLATVE